ncbi:MAG: response regulator transcription factor [Myxococcales bacterium]|nr:response regulator transcription factor [Myxococcales bacterium]
MVSTPAPPPGPPVEGAPPGSDDRTLLLVDDDVVFRDRLARAFGRRGFAVQVAGDYDEAIARVQAAAPSMAVVDLRMPGRSGLELVRDLLAIAPSLRITVLTGYGSIATAVDAVRLGAVNYLAKPADADDVLAAFARGTAPPLEAAPIEYRAPSLGRAEWEHIQRVLADCGGNIKKTARRLGIHRRTLQRKLQKYPPDR